MRTPSWSLPFSMDPVSMDKETLDVLCKHVDLYVDRGTDLPLAPCRACECFRNEADRHLVTVDSDDGEAHTVQGNRAFLDDIASQTRRECHDDVVPRCAGRATHHRADSVDVTLHQVTTQDRRRRGSGLKVDPAVDRDVAERRAFARLRQEVGNEPLVVDFGSSETDPVDRDRVAKSHRS